MSAHELVAKVLRTRLIDDGPLQQLEYRAVTTSTMDDAAAYAGWWPTPSMVIADYQSQGAGRLERSWEAPANTAILASLLIEAEVPPESRGWLPLISGVAIAQAIRRLGVMALLKWPNDVLIPTPEPVEVLEGFGRWRKVAGVLVRASADRYVMGWGVNVSQTAAQLPVPTATSLALAGIHVDRFDLLVETTRIMCHLMEQWRQASGDPHRCGLWSAYSSLSMTLGQQVQVSQPGGVVLTGRAHSIGDDGALMLEGVSGVTLVHAGDVALLRPLG